MIHAKRLSHPCITCETPVLMVRRLERAWSWLLIPGTARMFIFRFCN